MHEHGEREKVYTRDELRAMILPLLDRYSMASASLFGSYAHGSADENSAIDLLLVGKENFKALDVFGVAEELHRISGKRVDVYEMSELNEGAFRDAVLAEAVAL